MLHFQWLLESKGWEQAEWSYRSIFVSGRWEGKFKVCWKGRLHHLRLMGWQMAGYQRIKHVKMNSIQSGSRSLQLKKLHACSLSVKKTFKWCAFAFKNRFANLHCTERHIVSGRAVGEWELGWRKQRGSYHSCKSIKPNSLLINY